MPRIANGAIRRIFIFSFALVLGLWASGTFADYRIRFYVEKNRNFSAQEAERLIGKKVLIETPNQAPRTGTIVGTNHGGIEVCCAAIERKDDIRSVYWKDSFDKFVTVIDD